MEVARVETAECVELARAPNLVDAVSILYFFLLDSLFVELRRNLFGLDDPQQSQVVERRPQNGECHAHLGHGNHNDEDGEDLAGEGRGIPIAGEGNKVEIDQSAVAAWVDPEAYKYQRAAEYPAIVDQLDTLYHGGIDAWRATIQAVKDKYPKNT